MKQQLVTWFDCESDAGSALKATCLSVSWITCDLNNNFKIIEDLSGTLNSRFKNSRPFEVDAMLAHNIPIENIKNQKLSFNLKIFFNFIRYVMHVFITYKYIHWKHYASFKKSLCVRACLIKT